MSGFPRASSRRMYSWWWDSHISPKNSKWLQENLTDMDAKVKAMIKLIEEDADSFAKRAEMYYKKRPELMKLVEEFYRAYRALAERYDNATGVLRQAHITMAEAFPNMSDDSLENNASEVGPQTPDIPKQMGEGRVRKGLNFHDTENFSGSEVGSNFEKEIEALNDALAKLEAEKEAGLTQYGQTLEKLKKLELEISRVQEDSREFNHRANTAEGEVQALRVSLTELKAEKDASIHEYNKCLEKTANLENDVGKLNERYLKAESEKDEALERYKQSLEMISNLENKLKLMEQDARQLSERADEAEREVETLKQALARMTEENESTILQYQQCMVKISILEHKLSGSQEEVTKLKGAEELCLALEKSNEALNSELGSLVLKMGSQSSELTEKQKELGKLWTCLQEERFRFTEAESAFKTLQNLHSETQDQLRSLALEIENKGQLLRETEIRNETLLDEITRINEENKSLNVCNLSSSVSIEEMKNEISGLVNQKNELQQDIYSLKEDLSELNKRNKIMIDQFDAVGLSPDNFGSSVKQLQTENSDLKGTYEKERAEKALLLKKLTLMEQLIDKNALLEKSLSDLTTELEGAREKINCLEQSFESLLKEKFTILEEKAAVMSQLHATIENLEKISENNTRLENSLSNACDEVIVLKARSKTLEDSCQLLEKEKANLINEKDTFVSQGITTQQALETFEKRQRDLEEKYSSLGKEQQSTFSKLEELRLSLDVEKKEHDTFAHRTETRIEGMGKQIYLLQEEVFSRRIEFEEELDKAMNYQLEIFILRRFVEDLKEKNASLLSECQNLVEASKLSEKMISELKHDNFEKKAEVKFLSDKTSMFEIGIQELSKALGIDLGDGFTGDHNYLSKIEDTKNSLDRVFDENQQLNVEMSVILTLLGQLKLEAKTIDIERETLNSELEIKNKQLILSQNEANTWLKLNGDLNLKVSELTSLVDEANVVSKNKETKIHKLSDENMELELKLKKLQEEFELMTHQWESEAATMFGELQYSNVSRDLLEEKTCELKDGVTLKDERIENLGDEISTLKGENGELRAQLAAYSPLIVSLKESISSLERSTKLQKNHSDGAKEAVLMSIPNGKADQKAIDTFSELKDLNYRVKVIENSVVQKERLVAMKSSNNLKFRGSLNREYSVPLSDNSEFESPISMKDIVLDVNSESSPHELSRQRGRKYSSKMVESWDSADLDRCIDLAFKDKTVKSPPSEIPKPEKEVGVDKLEISRTFSQRNQESNKAKILERLNSEAQKLSDLQTTVQDLMNKIETAQKGKTGKSVYEHDTLREQLEEAEEAVLELSEYNNKLMRSVDKKSFSSIPKESAGSRRRRISENARKMSEKIGRLELEVRKIHFAVVKIDENEKEKRAKAKFMEMRRRVMLRDYFYGAARSPSFQARRKRSAFCGCIQPPTRK